jgi:hypothetical protein
MKMFCASCTFLLLAYPCGAVSFHAPQSAQEKEKFDLAQKDLNKIQDINNDLNRKDITDAQINSDKQKRLVLYNETIHAVIAAYGISPEHEEGTLVREEFKGNAAKEWNPMFDNRSARDALNKDGQDVSMLPPPSVSLTWADGQVTLGAGAFFGGKDHPYFASPALLASVIIHETVHYEQYTTPGRGDNMTHAELEMEAYKVQIGSAKEIGLMPDEVRLIGQGMTNGLQWIRAHPHSPFAIPDALGPDELTPDSDIESTKNAADDSFLKSVKQTINIVDDKRLFDKINQRRNEFACVPGARCEKRETPQQPSQRDLLWSALKEWTETACNYITPATYVNIPPVGDISGGRHVGPPNIDVEDMNAMTEAARENDRIGKEKEKSDQADRSYLTDHFVVMDQTDIDQFKSQNGLSSCQIEMANLLSQANGPVDSRWMLNALDEKKRQEVDKNRDALDWLVQKIIRGIPIAAAAIVRGISTPFIAIGDAVKSFPSLSDDSGGGNGGSGGNRGGGSNFHYNDGPSAGKLRGIAGGSMSFDN